MAFSHGGTENTEKILICSSEYSVYSVVLCGYLNAWDMHFSPGAHLMEKPAPCPKEFATSSRLQK